MALDPESQNLLNLMAAANRPAWISLTPEQARTLLGRTALLQFCERAPGANPASAQPCDTQGQWVQATGNLNGNIVPLTSRYLKANAQVSTDQIGRASCRERV